MDSQSLASSVNNGSSEPNAVSSSTNNGNSHKSIYIFLVVFLAFLVFVAVIIKIYFPSIVTDLYTSFNKPTQEMQAVSPEPSIPPITSEPSTSPVFVGKVNNIFNTVNFDSKDITFSGVMFKYKGKITSVGKSTDGMVSFKTDTQIQGLPNEWTFTGDNLTFDNSKPNNPTQVPNSTLKVGDQIIVAGIYMLTSKGTNPQANQFTLLHVEMN